eukprot:Platyproteum_vivax@DN4494_c0_g1_i1.p2
MKAHHPPPSAIAAAALQPSDSFQSSKFNASPPSPDQETVESTPSPLPKNRLGRKEVDLSWMWEAGAGQNVRLAHKTQVNAHTKVDLCKDPQSSGAVKAWADAYEAWAAIY